MSGDMSKKMVRDPAVKAVSQGPKVSRTEVSRAIEASLKRAYEATLSEAVPDRFLQLLAQLKEKEQKR
ncbi:NepR family anti-sigma factor [Tabrizicola sp.]|uniref:NepR family anti-sigma factor n=1 Tax=Tabrizicola sp. TaxID=2005166 RepID=UPI0027364E1E|nr:NepR family anti-sigma factor [Tabrizicola sp.]MDP3649077.1 NepR family anti-sigma factor [Paracoccaceae bacterium]